MAVLAIFSGNITKAQYDELRKEVNWEGNLAPGGVVHAASFDDAGHIHAADVWESPEALDSFVGQRLMPALQKLGIGPPEVAVYPVHNLNAYPAIEKYKM